MTSLNFTRNIRLIATFQADLVLTKNVKVVAYFKTTRQTKKLSQNFPTNPHGIVKKFYCNPNKIACMLDNCSSCESSAIVKILISNEKESLPLLRVIR